MPEHTTWFFRGAKTQEVTFPRGSGDSFCGLLAFLRITMADSPASRTWRALLPYERIKQPKRRQVLAIKPIWKIGYG
jgi:hypothetical protein